MTSNAIIFFCKFCFNYIPKTFGVLYFSAKYFLTFLETLFYLWITEKCVRRFSYYLSVVILTLVRILCMLSVLTTSLRFVLWSRIRSVLATVPYAPGKNMYLLLLGGVSYKCQIQDFCGAFQVDILDVSVSSVTEKGVLESPGLNLNLSLF